MVTQGQWFVGPRGFVSPLVGLDWAQVQAAYGIFLKDPAEGIRRILAAGDHSRWQAWVERRLARQATSLAERPIAIDLEALAKLPAHTLGGAYARHMQRYGFDPHTFENEKAGNNWLRQRMAISHDLYHIFTGFDASPIGEFGVAAYTLAQYRDLLNVFVLSFVPLSLTNPRWTWPLLRVLWRGLGMGLRGKAAIAYPVEANWATPLATVRRDLGLYQFFR
jgi:ubiquinone biosynthesis protein COQ4